MKKTKRNNHGYSLAELIIVIAIMVVMVGAVTFTVSLVFGWDSKQCAEELSGHLNNVRTSSLSKLGAEMRLVRDASDHYFVEYVEYKYVDDGMGNPILSSEIVKEYEVGKSSETIVCVLSNGTNVTISSLQSVTIGFDRSSGACTDVKENDVTTAGVYCESIEVTRANRTYAVILIPETGKVSVVRR